MYRTFAGNVTLDAFDEADGEEGSHDGQADSLEQQMLADHLRGTRKLDLFRPRSEFTDTVFGS